MLAHILLIGLAIQVPQITPRDPATRSERTGSGAIRGRVVAGDTGVPMRRAIVNLVSAQPNQPV